MRAALIAAGLMVVAGGALVIRAMDLSRVTETPARATAQAGGETVVRFELDAPGAGRVALVGDFNDWDPSATPMHREARDNRWSVSLPVSRGRHVYGFVVDRERWLPDPAAPRAPEDGFGSVSSVIVVNGGEP
jgi:1,4-alpha-glucan branching enzyme